MQRIILFFLRLLGPRYRLSPLVAEYFARSGRVGKTPQIPTELLPLAARLWTRGWFNRQFLDSHRDWILPYWATRQLDPTDAGFDGRALYPVLINCAYRDWTTIGNPESMFEAIVDPRGLLTAQPNGHGWSLDAWLRVENELYFPSRLDSKNITQKLYESLPLVQTRYEPGGLRMNQEAFAAYTANGGDCLIASYVIENPRGDARQVTVFLALRPFNPEGVAIVDHIELRAGENEQELWVNDEIGAYIPRPDHWGSTASEVGDIAFGLDALNGMPDVRDAVGLASAVAQYNLELRPHSQHVITAVLPMSETREPNPQAAQWTHPSALNQIKRDFSTHWRTLLAHGMTIRVPDEGVQDAFDANKAYLLLLHDGDSITAGPFLYHEFWFRDAAFLLHALDQLGYHEQVKKVLKNYPRRLRKDGYFLAQDGEWDSNGEALWAIEQHTRLSGDFEILHDQYWDLLNAAHWIDSARQKTKRHGERGYERGLLPAGMSAEHLGPNDFYFWDNWWGLAGLRAALFAASFFDNAADKQKLQAALDAYCSDVNAALARAAQANQAAWMPAAPTRRADSAMVSNLIASYPLQLLAADDARIIATQEELRRVSFVDGGFFHHVGHGGFGTYLALELAGSYLFQRKPESWDALRFLLKNASPTWTWAEALDPRTRHGGHGEGQHGWMSAELVSFVRNALLFEESDHLVITPALPKDWAFETTSIKVERAATYFGQVGFTLAFSEHNATLVLKGGWRELPAYIEWNLPLDIQNAGGDQDGVELIDLHRVRFPSNVSRVVATY